MRLAAALTVLLLGFSSGCGRSDLFSARGHGAGLGGSDGTNPDGGSGARDGGADGPVTCVQMREICNNGKDDNCNGLSDCADPRASAIRVLEAGPGDLQQRHRRRRRRLVDCADPDCVASLACRPTMGREICNNGKDDNDDGSSTAADPQCTTFPACLQSRARSTSTSGRSPRTARLVRRLDTTRATASYATCATPGGHGRVGALHAHGDRRRAARLQAGDRHGPRRGALPRGREPGLRSQPGHACVNAGTSPR